tara:strand:+ start:329 stop:580 length:252 start_codon:yes stop_codon:yes gene_type:complete
MKNIEILKLKDRHRIIKEHNFNTMEEVEAYRKAIDDYKSKQLTLTDVVKSDSELLLDYTEFLRRELHLNISDTWVESYRQNIK